jgi:hypothetical protein
MKDKNEDFLKVWLLWGRWVERGASRFERVANCLSAAVLALSAWQFA